MQAMENTNWNREGNEMNDYDQQYYFIRLADNDGLPFLTPDVNTEDREFRYQRQAMGSPPLVFFNGSKEFQQKRHIPSVKVPPDILFEGSNLVVCSRIREALLEFDIAHLHMHPAIYIHDDGKWHEDYWYMTFTEQFDCWDRVNSTYEEEPLEMGGMKMHSVYTYSLNKELLDKIPLEKRLLFEMGGTQDGYTVCHRSLLRLFIVQNGVKLTAISEC